MELLDSEGLRGNQLTFAKTFHKLTSSQGEPSSLAKQARQLAPTSQTSKAIGSDLLALLVGSTGLVGCRPPWSDVTHLMT